MKFIPHEYQKYTVDYLLNKPVTAIFLDCGLGKTVIALTAIFDLTLDSFQIRKVLIIAPLRVARDTWPAEVEKWDHLQGLTYSVAVGTEAERKAALMQKAQVYLINRENVPWRRTARQLEELGVLTEVDMAAFAGYCQAYARWKEAEEFISRHGTIVKTPSGYWQQVPQVSIAQTYLKIMHKFCEQFGLTPSARSRIIADKAGENEDPMELMLIQGGGRRG